MTVTAPTWFDDDVLEPEASGVDHVVVRLGGGRYAVCARDVAEVVPLPACTRLPGVPAWVTGVANWRGHVLPVVDLRPLLGLTVSALPSSARVVVVSVDDVEVGLVVEAVTGLVPVPVDRPDAPVTLTGDAATLLVGLAEGDLGGPIGLLGTEAVLALRARVGRQRR